MLTPAGYDLLLRGDRIEMIREDLWGKQGTVVAIVMPRDGMDAEWADYYIQLDGIPGSFPVRKEWMKKVQS